MSLKLCRYANLLGVEREGRINLWGIVSLKVKQNSAPLRVVVTYFEPSDHFGDLFTCRKLWLFPVCRSLSVHMKLFPAVSVARRRELYDVMTQPVYGRIINYCYISDTKRILNVICGSYMRTLYPQMALSPSPPSPLSRKPSRYKKRSESGKKNRSLIKLMTGKTVYFA